MGWQSAALTRSGLSGERVRGALEVIVAALYVKGRASVFLSLQKAAPSSPDDSGEGLQTHRWSQVCHLRGVQRLRSAQAYRLFFLE